MNCESLVSTLESTDNKALQSGCAKFVDASRFMLRTMKIKEAMESKRMVLHVIHINIIFQ